MRGLSRDFLDAMREKLEHGRRKGWVGWDRYWLNCSFASIPTGATGMFMNRLQEEVIELAVAIVADDKEKIRTEAADIANFAMFIADIHGALDNKWPPPKSQTKKDSASSCAL